MKRIALGPRLTRTFYDRPSPEVAADLIGALLLRRLDSGLVLIGRLVEVEAYAGDGSDPASHSHRGPTARNASMFGPPGHLYSYRIYGVHICANVVCGARGSGAAVLLRALEPLQGLAAMRRHRGLSRDAAATAIARGPGRLAQAMGLGLEHDGASLLGGELRLHAAPAGAEMPKIESGPRIGIRQATALPYRFFERASPWVSPFRSGRKRPN